MYVKCNVTFYFVANDAALLIVFHHQNVLQKLAISCNYIKKKTYFESYILISNTLNYFDKPFRRD